MTRTKICGIRTEEQAIAAARAGADFIGMVFTPSPRQATPDVAMKISGVLKKRKTKTETVGVFVNVHADTINRVVEMCGLDRAQLSGDEPWEYCRDIERPIIKCIRMSRNSPPGQVMKDIEYGLKILKGREIVILLDTGVPERYGGTGETFDWELARPIAREFPVVIAGGLTPDNVAEAIHTIHPWGVDVSSGVETNGAKDLKKIKKFIEAVRRGDAATR
jgi:phosphoribosylanthranilate isomerase